MDITFISKAPTELCRLVGMFKALSRKKKLDNHFTSKQQSGIELRLTGFFFGVGWFLVTRID